jgi:hypothetical protein
MCTEDLAMSAADLDQCKTELADCEALPSAVFPGDGVEGPELMYEVNEDRTTFTDLNTGLMWEMKVVITGPIPDLCLTLLHFVGSMCTWDQYTGEWIDAINLEALGGFDDWRPANVKELQSIVDYSIPVAGASIPASSVPGETANSFYWSSTTFASNPANAWFVGFGFGVVGNDSKVVTINHVRAVRGGQ